METTPVSKRRWLRYSLRTLFVCITLLAIGLGWVARERKQSAHELEIAEQLKAGGATVVFAGAFDVGLTDIQPAKEQSWWRKSLGSLLGARVFSVYIRESSDLVLLADLKDLQIIWLQSASVTDISPLVGLKNLKRVWLFDTAVCDLSPLAGLTTLERVQIGCFFRDIAPLAELKNLQILDLSYTQGNEEQVELLQQALPNCQIIK